jgi:FtsH-binding integral membrane protein
MLAWLIGLAGRLLDIWSAWIFFVVSLGAVFFLYKSMRRFYNQSRLQTTLKWFLFGIIYFLSFVLLMTIGSIVVFAVF